MEIVVKPLSPERTVDFFDFFNHRAFHRAFTDNPPWNGCYCAIWQMAKEEVKTELRDRAAAYGGGADNLVRAQREIVERQIASNALRGYLAYVDGVSIGWCNANDKGNSPAESANGGRLPAAPAGRTAIQSCEKN